MVRTTTEPMSIYILDTSGRTRVSYVCVCVYAYGERACEKTCVVYAHRRCNGRPAWKYALRERLMRSKDDPTIRRLLTFAVIVVVPVSFDSSNVCNNVVRARNPWAKVMHAAATSEPTVDDAK